MSEMAPDMDIPYAFLVCHEGRGLVWCYHHRNLNNPKSNVLLSHFGEVSYFVGSCDVERGDLLTTTDWYDP